MQFRCPQMTLRAGMTSHLTMLHLATDQTSPFYRSALPHAFFCSYLVLSGVFTLSLLILILLLANCCVVAHGQQHNGLTLLSVAGLLAVLLLPPAYSYFCFGPWPKGLWPYPGPLGLSTKW